MLAPDLLVSQTIEDRVFARLRIIIEQNYGQPITNLLLKQVQTQLTKYLRDERLNVFVELLVKTRAGIFELVRCTSCFPEERGVSFSIC